MKVYRIFPDVILPKYQTPNSACFDLHAYIDKEQNIQCYSFGAPITKPVIEKDGVFTILLYPQQRVLIPTGLVFELEEDEHMKIYPRSSVALKQGLSLSNSVGVIDSDYRDQVFLTMINHSPNLIEISNTERLAQAEVVKNSQVTIKETTTLPERVIGRDGGLGSTGK